MRIEPRHMKKLNQALNKSKSAKKWGLDRWKFFLDVYPARGWWSRWNRY